MWTFVLTDLAFQPLGEILNASDRSVDLPLNRLSTAAFKIRLDNPMADVITTTEGYIKVYRDGTLVFFGPIISAEEVAEEKGPTVAVNAVGSGWILTKRLTGKSTTGKVFATLTDRAQIIKTLIDDQNTLNFTGVATTGAISSSSAITYTAGPYRPVFDVLQELSASVDGFDWAITPTENFVNGAVVSQTIGVFSAAPIFGVTQQHAVFEYGVGLHNVASYRSTVTRDGQATKVYHYVQPEQNQAFPQVSYEDVTATSKWKLLDDVAQADLTNQTNRLALVQDHVQIRKNPRRLVEFTPHIDPENAGRLPYFGVAYSLGDFVRARVQYNDRIRLDGYMRVWGVTFSIDELGIERTTLALMDA